EPIRSLDVLAADVDDRRISTDRVAAQRNAFEHAMWLNLDQLAIFERARLGLVGIDGHVLGARSFGDEAPLGPGWKARPASSAQSRSLDLLDNFLGRHLGQRFVPAHVAVFSAV